MMAINLLPGWKSIGHGLYEDPDGLVTNDYPQYEEYFDSMHGWIRRPKPGCTCGGKHTELRTHYTWCDLNVEVKK